MRAAERSRRTRETTVEVDLALDGSGRVEVSTGLPFFDHMVSQLGRHGGQARQAGQEKAHRQVWSVVIESLKLDER